MLWYLNVIQQNSLKIQSATKRTKKINQKEILIQSALPFKRLLVAKILSLI